MTTYQSLRGSTLAYNARGHWSRCHSQPYWSLCNEEMFGAAVVDDFGSLVLVPWRLQ